MSILQDKNKYLVGRLPLAAAVGSAQKITRDIVARLRQFMRICNLICSNSKPDLKLNGQSLFYFNVRYLLTEIPISDAGKPFDVLNARPEFVIKFLQL